LIKLAQHFVSDDRSRHSEWLRQRKWFISAKEQRIRKEKLEEQADEAFMDFASSVIMATEADIEAFEVKLDTYHEASTQALIDNQIEFEALQEQLLLIDARLEGVWKHANTMDDGRRVFLNSERSQAYDEFGVEVSNEEYSYDNFAADHYPVDSFLDDLKERGKVHEAMKDNRLERDKIHAFEEKIEEAHERIEEGDLSKEELDQMDADLLEAMPDSVKANIPELNPAENAPAIQKSFSAHASPITQVQQNLVKPATEFGLNGG